MKTGLLIIAALVTASSMAFAGHRHGGGHHHHPRPCHNCGGGSGDLTDGDRAVSAGLGASLITTALDDAKVVGAQADAIQFVATGEQTAALQEAMQIVRANSQVEMTDGEVLATILSAGN